MSPDPVEVKVKDTLMWFQKARDDIHAAELLLPAALVDQVGFHCQQAVEKCLKGYLSWNDQPFKRAHDLNTLSDDCQKIDHTLKAELAVIAPLQQYAVEYCYPGPEVHPTQDEAEELIQLAKTIYQEIGRRLPFSID